MFAGVGTMLLRDNVFVGVAFVVGALLLTDWLVFVMTSCVTLDASVLTRTWKCGSYSIPIKEITRLEWGGGRGQTFLTVRADKRWVLLSSLPFAREELQEIENAILSFRGLQGKPKWPPYSDGYIDVAEMAKRFGQSG
jgi:hypothetical protein